MLVWCVPAWCWRSRGVPLLCPRSPCCSHAPTRRPACSAPALQLVRTAAHLAAAQHPRLGWRPAEQQQQRHEQQQQHEQRHGTAPRSRRPPALTVVCAAAAPGAPLHADYAAKAGDSAVLQRPLKSELLPEEIHNVFGSPRNLKER